MGLCKGTLERTYKKEVSVLGTDFLKGVATILLAILFLFPVSPLASDYWLRLIIDFSITIIAVIGLNVLIGNCGQGSIAQAAFMAVGGYSSAILIGKVGLPFWIALPCAVLFAGSLGAFFGLVSIRVKGLYLFLVTLGAHFIIEYAIMHLRVTGGTSGIPVSPPELAGFVFDSLRRFYYLVSIVLIISILLASNLSRGHIGRAWVAIRDREIVAKAMGIDVFRYKLIAFFVGCGYAGIAGAFWAHSKCWIAPDDFSLMQACWLLGMTIIGGLGRVTGSILGPIFLLGLGELTAYIGPLVCRIFPSIPMGIFAALAQLISSFVIILFLVFEPRGLVHWLQRLMILLNSRMPEIER